MIPPSLSCFEISYRLGGSISSKVTLIKSGGGTHVTGAGTYMKSSAGNKVLSSTTSGTPFNHSKMATTHPHEAHVLRMYDIVVLGPTGYTGRFCAEHIVKNFPTDLVWAIAGRSPNKIKTIAEELKALNPDRREPDVLTVHIDPAELDELAQKTRLIINCIGPYILYGTPVVEACAKHGTHYVDVLVPKSWRVFLANSIL